MKPGAIWIAALLILGIMTGCTGAGSAGLPTPLPAGYMPTAVALTLEAQGVDLPTPGQSSAPASAIPTAKTPLAAAETSAPETSVLDPGAQASPTLEATASPAPPTATPLPIQPLDTPTATLAPPFPDAPIQILRVGDLSKIKSPLPVSLSLTSRLGKVVRVELYGEDGRLLARHLRTYTRIPWDIAKVGVDLDFGISAAAEEGRLVVSVEDQYGRLMDVNSLNLILISTGQSEYNPPTALWQRLIIEEPVPKALIQGGKLVISGRALPNDPEQPLRVMLIGEDGRVLGQRLAGVKYDKPGDYGKYVAEVPYSVTDLTPALLVIYEEGKPISAIAHLSSLEVILVP